MSALVTALAFWASVRLRGGPGLRSLRPPVESPPPQRALLSRLRIPLGVLVGIAAWAFIGHLVGIAAGVVASVFAWRALSKVRSPEEVKADRQLAADYPLVVELLASALEAGRDVASALDLVGAAVGSPWHKRLATPLHALAMGQSPDQVWHDLEADPRAAGLGRVLGRAQATGAPVAEAMRRLARDLREESDLAAYAYARTIEVKAAAPLGVCFLPAFVLLGVVPLVAGVVGDLSWLGAA